MEEERSFHDTQPFDDDSLEESSSESSTSMNPVYAKLEPLMDLVPRIELRTASFVCGRGFSTQVDFNFTCLREAKHWMYEIISKKHFRLDRIDGKTILRDLSFNGTFVDQKLVGKGNTHVLENGNVIGCSRKDLHVFLYEENCSSAYPTELTSKYIMTNTSLGKGGYGVVMMGKLRRNCEVQVAVKILDTARLSERFSREVSKAKDVEKEVSIMLKINHPNCTQFMDWIEFRNTAYIVMEMVGGGELFDRIVAEKWGGIGFGEDLCKFYGWQLLSAVEYLHQNHITHRDIKPENILCMTKDDYTVVKLTDFGLAKGSVASTMKSFCGTPAYMAPEMIDNDNLAYNPRVDMWSLGVVLFTGICGYPPFSEDYGDMDLNSQIKKGRLIFYTQWKFVTLETQYVIKSMLKVDPMLRLSAADALRKPWLCNSPAVSRAKGLVEKYKQSKIALECQRSRVH